VRGKAAIDAAPKVREQISNLLDTLRGDLKSPVSDKKFSDYSRRFRAITNAQIGSHTDRQYVTWMTGVNKASEKVAINSISNNALSEEGFPAWDGRPRERAREAGAADVWRRSERRQRSGGVGQAGCAGGTAEHRCRRQSARAIRMLETNKSTAGAKYDNLYSRFRARADQQIGREAADSVWARCRWRTARIQRR
jgi:hypothetical protein